MTTVRVLLLHHKLKKHLQLSNSYTMSTFLIFCTSTEHVFNVSAVLSHCELHTTIDTIHYNVLATTEF